MTIIDEIPLSERALYDTVFIEIKLPFLDKVHKNKMQKDFVHLLKSCIFDDEKRKELMNVYGTSIVHVGNKSERTSVIVDGEVVHKKGR